MESILLYIKNKLGFTEEYTEFDDVIIGHINSAIARLCTILKSHDGFFIEDDSATWADFLGEDSKWNVAKDYIYIKVKLIFDPPASATVLKALEEQADEYEWVLSLL